MSENREKRSFFVGIRLRMLLTFMVLFIVVMGIIFFWFQNMATDMAMENLRNDLMATALSAAAGIDGDAHANLYVSGEMDDETYTEIADYLRSVIHTNPKAAGIYTYIQAPTETDRVHFVVSSILPPGAEPSKRDLEIAEQSECALPAYSRPDMGSEFGWEEGLSPTMLAGVRQAGAETELWSDEWGEWLSGYAPIYNSEGEPVGAVGVDMCAADVRQLRQNIRNTVLPMFGITIVILAFIIFIIAMSITEPIITLTKAAEGVAQVDYEQDFTPLYSGLFKDEVATLAQVFGMMVDKVREREQKLRERVAELQIIIDERKRERQVKQIAESEFFRDLQAKARVMRSRSKDNK